jgi:hypothetical protein
LAGDDEQEEMRRFAEGESDRVTDRLHDPIGPVTVQAETSARCHAQWGGWLWMAEGSDRERAFGRLHDRMRHLNPFTGVDWGEPGYLLGTEDELDERIPQEMREQMLSYEEARSEAERIAVSASG